MCGPTTRVEAEAYRYNKWGGNPKGRAYDPLRCAYEVFPQERGALHDQCQRKPGHGPEGLFCKQHAAKVEAPAPLCKCGHHKNYLCHANSDIASASNCCCGGYEPDEAPAPPKPSEPTRERDNCQLCDGWSGGVKGNENRVDGIVMCDYCSCRISKYKELLAVRSLEDEAREWRLGYALPYHSREHDADFYLASETDAMLASFARHAREKGLL